MFFRGGGVSWEPNGKGGDEAMEKSDKTLKLKTDLEEHFQESNPGKQCYV